MVDEIELVTVIIPVFNTEDFISDAIKSVQFQTYPNIEIIVIDDGSTDRTIEILCELQKDDARIKIFRQQNNGACAARNKGIDESTGSYLMFLDGDDLISKDKIETQLKILKNHKTAIASCAWIHFSDTIQHTKPNNSEPIYKNYHNPIELLLDMWEQGLMMQTACWLVPKEIIQRAGKWEESLKRNQDGEYFTRVILSSTEVKFGSGPVVYYRMPTGTNISKQTNYGSLNSLLKSFILNKASILKEEDSKRTRHACYMNFASFIYVFYNYFNDLNKEAILQIRSLGFNKLEPVGGRNFVKIARLIGFENTLRIRKLLNKKLKV